MLLMTLRNVFETFFDATVLRKLRKQDRQQGFRNIQDSPKYGSTTPPVYHHFWKSYLYVVSKQTKLFQDQLEVEEHDCDIFETFWSLLDTFWGHWSRKLADFWYIQQNFWKKNVKIQSYIKIWKNFSRNNLQKFIRCVIWKQTKAKTIQCQLDVTEHVCNIIEMFCHFLTCFGAIEVERKYWRFKANERCIKIETFPNFSSEILSPSTRILIRTKRKFDILVQHSHF